METSPLTIAAKTAVAVAILAVGAVLIFRSGDAVRRRRLWRWGLVPLVAIYFVGSYLAQPDLSFLLLNLILAPIWIWYAYKAGRFCDACGRLQVRFFTAPWQSIRPSPKCVRCGAQVDGR